MEKYTHDTLGAKVRWKPEGQSSMRGHSQGGTEGCVRDCDEMRDRDERLR